MTINDAIKLLHSLQGKTPDQLATTMQQALRLGIEALKWRLYRENVNKPGKFPLLQGETKE